MVRYPLRVFFTTGGDHGRQDAGHAASGPDSAGADDVRCDLRKGRAMRIGVPKEIREEEYRVALTPAGTKELTSRGHEVLVEHERAGGSPLPR